MFLRGLQFSLTKYVNAEILICLINECTRFDGIDFAPSLIIMGRTARKNVCISSHSKAREAAASKIISRTDFIPALPINSAYYEL